MNQNHHALHGLKVIDCATMLAAPWATTYLADFGAEVIKIEHPEKGDSARKYGAVQNDLAPFWKTISRNKQCITLNLNSMEGKEIFLMLVKEADVLVENFRAGTMEKWGIGWDILQEINPRLIMLRCTGFGQEGPYSKRGGFGTIAEAMSGFAAMNGYPDSPPTLPPIALADGVTGIFAALSIMIAIYERDVYQSNRGQVIDINLYEPLMRLNECSIVEYSAFGILPKRVGNRISTAAPRNSYQTKEGSWVAISASAQPIAENVFQAIGQPELINDPRFCDNPNRVKHVDELDEIISEWVGRHSTQEVQNIFLSAGAVVGPVYEIDQIFSDEHVKYRQSLVEVEDEDFGSLIVPNVMAKFSRTPGRINHLGSSKGKHNYDVYSRKLHFSKAQIDAFKEKGII